MCHPYISKIVDVCNFVRHRWLSRLAEDGRWWLHFPSVFSEDETMWIDVDSGLRIANYDRWPSRLAEDGQWWLRFPSIFSEDETMWIVDCDRCPSKLAEDGRWWLRFPSVFNDNETMCLDNVG